MMGQSRRAAKPGARSARNRPAPRKLVWLEMLTDLLFLRRFYGDPDPWRNLRAIHESVLIDFAPAHRLGFTIYPRD